MRVRSDLAAAAMLLTRLPVGWLGAPSPRASEAAWAWPLAGLLTGGLAGCAGLAAWGVGATPPVAAALVLASQLAMTGALHEDGLADVADGFWGGQDRTRRLEIMRDSRIGTYGAAALILTLLLRWSLIATALLQGHLVAAVATAALVSRVPMIVAMRWLPPARADGLSRHVGRPPAWGAQVAVVVAVLALAFWGGQGLVAGGLAVAVLAGIGALARSRVGGQTGDVLGAMQQMSEIAVLAALTAG